MPISSGRLLPKPNGDLHVVDSAIEDTQVLKCLITGAGGNKAKAPEMIVYEHVLFGEFCGAIRAYRHNVNKDVGLIEDRDEAAGLVQCISLHYFNAAPGEYVTGYKITDESFE